MHDLFSLRHFLLEGRIVSCEPAITVRRLHQEEPLPVPRAQSANNFFGQDDTERVAEFAGFEFYHVVTI